MKAHRSSTSSSDTPGRTALRAAGWAVAVVVAADLACRVLLPTGWLVEHENATRARVERDPAPDIQVVGDSVARSGLIASTLADGSTTSRNDAVAAGGTPKTYLLLARQFAAGHVPKVLIVAHSPHTFGQVRYEVLIGSFAHWNEVPALLAKADPWTDGLYGVLTRLSYILMHRDSFRELLTKGDASFFRGDSVPLEHPPDMARLERYRRELASGTFKWGRAGGKVSDFQRQPFVVKEMNDHYFREILALAKAHGVKVFWVTMPSPARVAAVRAASGYEAEFLKYLREFESQGDLTILRGEFAAYPDELFSDGLHLNAAGAFRLACELVASQPVVLHAAHRTAITDPAKDAFHARLAPYCPSGGKAARPGAALTTAAAR